MAPHDRQDPAGTSSETSSSDAGASQHACSIAARRRPPLSSSRTGKQLKVSFSTALDPANSHGRESPGAASADAHSTSQAGSSDVSSSACLKNAKDDACRRPCLRNTKCLKKSRCLKGNLEQESDSSIASTSAVEDDSESDPSGENDDASTDVSTPGADSSKGDSSDERGPEMEMHKSGASSVDSGGWSASEDCLLRSLKESKDDLPWVEIGTALGRTKNDVRARWVVIKDQPAQFAYSDEASGEETESLAQESQGPSKPSQKPAKGSDEARSAVDAPEPVRDAKGKGKAKVSAPAKWRKEQRNDKVALENKSARSKAAETNERERDILSGEEASSESLGPLGDEEEEDDDDDGLHYGWPESKRQDARYMRNHIYPELYPSKIRPESDEFFGEHDCAVLAAVDSKYKRSRWLEMQANFYNVTGRMVPLYLIRDKCERAEAQQPSSPVDERWERVESWVQGVQDGGLGDPAL